MNHVPQWTFDAIGQIVSIYQVNTGVHEKVILAIAWIVN